jgi:hypothetical protein
MYLSVHTGRRLRCAIAEVNTSVDLFEPSNAAPINQDYTIQYVQGVCKMELEQNSCLAYMYAAMQILGIINFIRRKPGQQWTRHCLTPHSNTVCHYHEPFGKTFVRDSTDENPWKNGCRVGVKTGAAPNRLA